MSDSMLLVYLNAHEEGDIREEGGHLMYACPIADLEKACAAMVKEVWECEGSATLVLVRANVVITEDYDPKSLDHLAYLYHRRSWDEETQDPIDHLESIFDGCFLSDPTHRNVAKIKYQVYRAVAKFLASQEVNSDAR